MNANLHHLWFPILSCSTFVSIPSPKLFSEVRINYFRGFSLLTSEMKNGGAVSPEQETIALAGLVEKVSKAVPELCGENWAGWLSAARDAEGRGAHALEGTRPSHMRHPAF